MPLIFRSAADDYTSADAALYGISFPPHEGMTQPEFKADCDINTIISRYEAAQAPLPISDISHYLDYSQVTDYQTAMQSVAAIGDYFDSLPATVRKRFANDPSELLAFLDQPQNRSEAEILGLVSPSLSSKGTQAITGGAVAGEGSGEGGARPEGGRV